MGVPAQGRNRLLRAAAFLVCATIGGIALGEAMRQQDGPQKAKPKAEYIGMEGCIGCHKAPHDTWADTIHGKLLQSANYKLSERSCEGCHGPGSVHADTEDPKDILDYPELPAKQVNDLCLRCHQTSMTSHNFKTTAHSLSKMKCTDCHQIMEEKAKDLLKQPEEKLCYTCHSSIRANLNSYSHHPVVEGTMKCGSCHEVHSGAHSMLKKEQRSLCSDCHAQMKGPFIYEHSPNVNGWGGECTACHNPHGSSNPNMTVLADRGLCQRCHTDLVTHYEGAACTTPGCHHYIHGSNNSRLFFIP